MFDCDCGWAARVLKYYYLLSLSHYIVGSGSVFAAGRIANEMKVLNMRVASKRPSTRNVHSTEFARRNNICVNANGVFRIGFNSPMGRV